MKNRTTKISLLSSVLLLGVANTNLFAATCPQTSPALFCVDFKDTNSSVLQKVIQLLLL